MSVVLTVDRQRWIDHIDDTLTAFGGRVTPVIKGNGYGFGRHVLLETARSMGFDSIAVGTVFEVAGSQRSSEVLVMTPTLDDVTGVADSVVLTVASRYQLRHLLEAGYQGRIALKLESSMHRHGFAADDLPTAAELERLQVRWHVLHLPLVGTMESHRAEVERWLPVLDERIPVSISHVDVPTFAALRADHPERAFTVRLGTQLWLGDKSALRLRANVLDVRPVKAGETVGYRAAEVPKDGQLVIVGAGSAHGVTPLDDGRSPFHFERRRIDLLEPPHMHASIAFVPEGQPNPLAGDWVDVQRPLTMTLIDHIEWVNC